MYRCSAAGEPDLKSVRKIRTSPGKAVCSGSETKIQHGIPGKRRITGHPEHY